MPFFSLFMTIFDLSSSWKIGNKGVQKLMRQAQISTTMNVYGNALMDAKREANSKVVRIALRSA